MDYKQEKQALLERVNRLLQHEVTATLPSARVALAQLEQELGEDTYMVVVLGEFKRGKSTFINALLGSPVLPMNVLPETATINILSYSEEPELTVHYTDGHTEQGEVTTEYLKQFSAASAAERSGQVDYISIGYPLEMLKNNITLVDTPGVSDLNEQRCAVTYGITPRANAVLFLLDAASPLKASEYEFIEEKLLNIGVDNIIFIVNRYDFVDEDEEEDFLADIEVRLRNAFTKDGVQQLKNIRLLPLSALMALNGVERGDETLIAASGLNEVKAMLQELLENGSVEQGKITGYQRRLAHIVELARAELASEMQLKSSSADELNAMNERLATLMREAEQNKASIHKYIESIKPEIYAMTDKSLSHFSAKLQEELEFSIESYAAADFKGFVERQVTRRIKNNYENWLAVYVPHIDSLLRALERELAHGMSYFFQQQIQTETKRAHELQPVNFTVMLEGMDTSSAGHRASLALAAGSVGVMAVFGAAIMPVVGIAAIPFLREQSLKTSLAKAKQMLLPALATELANINVKLRQELHKYIDEAAEKIRLNNECAYDNVLQTKKLAIDVELAKNKTDKAGVVAEMDKLSAYEQLLMSVLK